MNPFWFATALVESAIDAISFPKERDSEIFIVTLSEESQMSKEIRAGGYETVKGVFYEQKIIDGITLNTKDGIRIKFTEVDIDDL